jgi:DnaJ-class molecular chaperone
VQVDVPKDLSSEQRAAVEQLATAFNGDDPREELLRRAGQSGGSGKVSD